MVPIAQQTDHGIIMTDTPKPEHSISTKSNSQQWHMNAYENTLKKHKTRSKQKNIRRDNRSNELKPSYLRVGAEDYMGRPLTKV